MKFPQDAGIPDTKINNEVVKLAIVLQPNFKSTNVIKPVHKMTQDLVLFCVGRTSIIVTAQQNAGIDSNHILAFLCAAFIRLVAKNG